MFLNCSPVCIIASLLIVTVRQNTRLYEKQLNDTLATVLSFSRYDYEFYGQLIYRDGIHVSEESVFILFLSIVHLLAFSY